MTNIILGSPKLEFIHLAIIYLFNQSFFPFFIHSAFTVSCMYLSIYVVLGAGDT